MKLWSLFGSNKATQQEERFDQPLTLEQYGQQVYHSGSHLFPYGHNLGSPNGKVEVAPNDFQGYVSAAYKSSGIVFACCEARRLIFSEVQFAYQKTDRVRPGDLAPIPGVDVLESPWPNGTAGDLLSRAIQDVDMAGNHYAVRQDKPGQPPRIRRLRPDWVEIVMDGDPETEPDVNIVGYIYKPSNTDNPKKWEIFPVDGSNGAIAHWAPIPDPTAQFRGMSWMTPVLSEIIGDKAIAKHKNKYFANAATPNLAVALKESVSAEEFAEFQSLMNAGHQGVDNAYKTLFLGGGADVKVIGANMDQMSFIDVTAAGETRIAAAARVHPTILGTADGLSGSSMNEGNFEAAKDSFASGTLRPLWRSLCAAYTVLVDVPTGHRLWFKDSEIAFLHEDREKVARREQLEATTITRLVMQGYTPDSVVEAVLAKDWSLLEHTGLYSVQLLPPNVSNPEDWGDADKNGVLDYEEEQNEKEAEKEKDSEGSESGDSKKSEGGDKKKAPSASKANNNPTGSKRKPVGRPPKSESKSGDVNDWELREG